jgi:hypothetical protein
MRVKFLLCLSAAGLVATSATAQVNSVTSSNGPRPRNNEVTANGNLDEIICRQSPPPLGSRLGHRRICMTRAQWLEQNQTQAGQREALERTQRQLFDSRGDPGRGN